MSDERTQSLFDRLRRGGHDAYLWQRLAEGHKKTIWIPEGGSIAVAEGKKNIYWSVHSGMAARRTATNRLTNAEVTAINCLYADVDWKIYEGDRGKALAHVYGLSAVPNVVVDSGGGFHCYWMLDETVTLDANGIRERVTRIQAAWVGVVGADPEAKDLARVLRVPGTWNIKYDPLRLVDFERYTEGTWPLAELIELLPEGWETVENRVLSPLPTPELGDAHGWLRNEAARMVARGDPDDVIMTVLRTVNEQQGTGIEEARLRRFIESGRKKYAGAILGGSRSAGGQTEPPDEGANDVDDPNAGVIGFEHVDDGKRLHQVMKGQTWFDRRARTWYAFDHRLGVWRTGHAAASVVFDAFRAVRQRIIPAEIAQTRSARRRSLLLVHEAKHLRNDPWMRNVIKAYSGFEETSLEASGIRFDATPGLVKVANGTVELATGMFREDRIEDYITRRCPTRYVEGAANARWEEFVAWTMGGDAELAAFMQRLAGYALIGTNNEQVFPILHGWGRNGKGTFCGTLVSVLGPELAGTTDKRVILSRPRQEVDLENALTLLEGRRLVWISEPGPGDELRQDRVKEITGHNPIAARLKYTDIHEFTPTVLVVLDTNTYPVVPNWDLAMRRRLLVVEFESTCSAEEANPHLMDEILAAGPEGILGWAIRGAGDVWENGLRPPAKTQEWTDSFVELEDWRQSFLEDTTLQVPGNDPTEVGKGSASLGELHNVLTAWWKDNQSTRWPPTKRDLSQVLQALGYSLKTVGRGETTVRAVLGLRIREEWQARALAESEWRG